MSVITIVTCEVVVSPGSSLLISSVACRQTTAQNNASRFTRLHQVLCLHVTLTLMEKTYIPPFWRMSECSRSMDLLEVIRSATEMALFSPGLRRTRAKYPRVSSSTVSSKFLGSPRSPSRACTLRTDVPCNSSTSSHTLLSDVALQRQEHSEDEVKDGGKEREGVY